MNRGKEEQKHFSFKDKFNESAMDDLSIKTPKHNFKVQVAASQQKSKVSVESRLAKGSTDGPEGRTFQI
jgi:hypothetical protein